MIVMTHSYSFIVEVDIDNLSTSISSNGLIVSNLIGDKYSTSNIYAIKLSTGIRFKIYIGQITSVDIIMFTPGVKITEYSWNET